MALSKSFSNATVGSSTYTQDVVDSGSGTSNRNHASKESRKSSNTRNLVSESSVTRASHDKANIAFTIAFTHPFSNRAVCGDSSDPSCKLNASRHGDC